MFKPIYNNKLSAFTPLKRKTGKHIIQGLGLVAVFMSSQAFAATTSICSNNVADVGADLSHDVAAVFDSSKQTFDVIVGY